MSSLRLITRKRVLAVAAVAAATAALSLTTATGARAATPTGATGTTVVVIGGPAVSTLQSGSCGTLVVTGNNGATVAQTAKNQWKLTLKISDVLVNDNGGIQLRHSGSVELQNDCYDITLAALRISNFGSAGQFTTFDLNAVLHSSNDGARYVVGELDLSSAQVSVTGNKVRVEKANLSLSDQGAQEFNQLATGSDTGPFVSGEKIGNAKTTAVFSYLPV